LAVTNVEWYLAETLMGRSSATSSSFLWDTTGSTNGSYILQARAYDAANNVGTSLLTVAVQNPVPGTNAPLLRITTSSAAGAPVSGPQSGTQILISWPASFTGYTLYSTLSLPPASWTSEGTGTLSGGQYWVTNTPSGPRKFYRLQK
jgi:hypothetical protein